MFVCLSANRRRFFSEIILLRFVVKFGDLSLGTEVLTLNPDLTFILVFYSYFFRIEPLEDYNCCPVGTLIVQVPLTLDRFLTFFSL